MSTPVRGRGGRTARGGTTITTTAATTSGGGSSNARTSQRPSGRGRGRGRDARGASATTNRGGLLQKLRAGTVQRQDGGSNATPSTRGRGSGTPGSSASKRSRGNHSISSSSPTSDIASTIQTVDTSSYGSMPSSYRDFMAQMTEKFQTLKPKRDVERKQAITDGFLSDPDKKTSLANAITPVGTCTEMCPEFERVERIVQNMVDKTEKVQNEVFGREIPSEARMIKRFRRSAAGYDEQLPSDIRTPETLRRTLDYLLDKVIGGGERLASIHKFVWDRTRGIRNDFSIQQVTKAEDVRIAVDCYERIARFHILSLHQLSNSDNLQEGEHFDAHQEREQLNNTLLSLMYYYDDNRKLVPLPNEPEFRAYCILFELQALTPDLEERMQSWPRELLNNPKIQTAFKIYAAAGNTVFDQGPLRPLVPFSVAQANAGSFWTLLASHQVSYLMACVAEMNFGMVRFTALDALWRSGKSAPQGQQQKNQDWTLAELTEHLGFDDDEQTWDFVQEFGLAFGTSQNGDQFLDLTAFSSNTLDRTMIPAQQTFSYEVVEQKRYHRTLVAVINGRTVAAAIREGLVVDSPSEEADGSIQQAVDDSQSLFVPEQAKLQASAGLSSTATQFNPQATAFTPTFVNPFSAPAASESKPSFSTAFGQTVKPDAPVPGFGQPSAAFAPQPGATNAFASQDKPVNNNSTFGFPSKQAPLPNPFSGFSKSPAAISSKPNALQAPTTENSQPSFQFGQLSTAFTPAASIGKSDRGTPAEKQTPVKTTEVKEQKPIGSEKSSRPDGTSNATAKWQFSTPSSISAAVTDVQQTPLPTFSFGLPSVQPSSTNDTVSNSALASTARTEQSPSVQSQIGSKIESIPKVSTATTVQQTTPTAPSSTSTAALFGNQIGLAPKQNFAAAKKGISTPSSSPSQQIINSTSLEPANSSADPAPAPRRSQLADASSQRLTENITPSDDTTTHAPLGIAKPLPTPSEPPISNTPKQPSFTKADHDALVGITARLAITQNQGLMEYFISHHVSNLLQKFVVEHQKNVHETVIAHVKSRFLARKFFYIWKDTTRRSVLSKRGQQRRKLLAAAMQAEVNKKRRDEQELEAILAATQETKRLQAEAKARNEELRKQPPKQQSQALEQRRSPHIQVGIKRKESDRYEYNQTSLDTIVGKEKGHKRSRTVDVASEPSKSFRISSSSSDHPSTAATSRLSQSFFGRSSSPQMLRRSLSSQRIDSTKTDYFKLKAMGIDPDTPLIPDTAATLAARQRKQEYERQGLASRIRMRQMSISRSSTPVVATTEMPPPSKPVSLTLQDQPTAQMQKSERGDQDEDELLKSLRKAREAMSVDEEWFRTAAADLETEIQQEEHTRQSRRSLSSSSSLRMSVNGLAQTNGYEFVPAQSTSRSSLSRTEQRIRTTGAHGLATKPLGRRPVDDHTRKRNFSDLDRLSSPYSNAADAILTSELQLKSSTSNSKRYRTDESDHQHNTFDTSAGRSVERASYAASVDHHVDPEEPENTISNHSGHVFQRGGYHKQSRVTSNESVVIEDPGVANKKHHHPHRTASDEELVEDDDYVEDIDGDEDAEEEDEESAEEEEEEEEEDDEEGEGDDEDDDEDDEDDEEEEEDEDVDDEGHIASNHNFSHLLMTSESKGTDMSTTSFTADSRGASADDAFVLSD